MPGIAAASLSTLGRRYGTDKVEHGFTETYDRILSPFRLDVHRVLEVGVYFGSSLRMWHEYFPNAEVWGVDTFKGVQGYTTQWGANKGKRSTFANADQFLNEWRAGKHKGIKLVVGNQSDETDMERVVRELRGAGQYDIIVEDGSHLNRDQQRNLVQLFPLVAPGGIYIVEDLHCSLQSGFDEPRGGPHTALRVLQRYNSSGILHSRYLDNRDVDKLVQWIESVEIICSTPTEHRQRHRGCFDYTGVIRKRYRKK